MSGRKLSGATFKPTTFTPVSSTLSGKECHGVAITIVDRNPVDVPALGIELAAALEKLYPKDFGAAKMKGLLANDADLDQLMNGADPKRMVAGWQRPLRNFRKRRRRYLLYPELK
jgi:uncharacterized protein YbbC (DUF1343 family)